MLYNCNCECKLFPKCLPRLACDRCRLFSDEVRSSYHIGRNIRKANPITACFNQNIFQPQNMLACYMHASSCINEVRQFEINKTFYKVSCRGPKFILNTCMKEKLYRRGAFKLFLEMLYSIYSYFLQLL